jgi:ketosteroid isomerase-like protein
MNVMLLIAVLIITQQSVPGTEQSDGQSSGASASTAEQDTLRQLSERALMSTNAEEILELADEDLIICNAAGQITTIAEIRRGLGRGGKLQGLPSNTQLRDLKLQLHGNTAIVAGVLSAPPSAEAATGKGPTDGRVLLVWIKHGLNWKLHALQTTMVARRAS